MTTVLVSALVAALVAGAIGLLAAGPGRRAPWVGRIVVVALAGLVVGELVSMLALHGPITDRLRADADRAAASTPAVRAAQADLDAASADRAALDSTVAEASSRRDRALVVARCEYRPGPACPQTSITGVPGQGPETRTANQRLAAAQTDLDRATAARAARAPGLDARVTTARSELRATQERAAAAADDGIGVRWVAMGAVTAHSLPAAALRLAIDLACVLLALLPLLVRRWRGETVSDIRHRRDLESERLAAAAQLAIDRRTQERRVERALAEQEPAAAALGGAAAGAAALEAAGFEPVAVTARRYVRPEPVASTEDDFLPIAAAAEAASLAAVGRPAADDTPTEPIPVADVPTPLDASPVPAEEATVPDENIPHPPAVRADTAPAVPAPPPPVRAPNPFVPPVLDEAARTLAGFVRPLVPPIVARVLPGGGTRTVTQSYEEVEEVTFAMRRTRRVTVGTVEQDVPAPSDDGAPAPAAHPGAAGTLHEPLDVAHEPVVALPAQGARELGQPGELPRGQ